MTTPSDRRLLKLGVLLLLVLQPGWAWAYIDPNATGLLFQWLAPVFAAVVAGWVFLHRMITTFFRRLWHWVKGKAAP